MSDVLRSFDPNYARRQLRELLVELAAGSDQSSAVPHSFDTAALLAHAMEVLGQPTLQKRADLHHELLARTGVVCALCGREEEALDLFERGLRSSRSNQRRARFQFHIGHHHYERRGQLANAREALVQAFVLSERSRRLRTETLLALGSTEARLGLHEAALKSLESALDLHVRDLEPHALMRQGIVHMDLGDHETAHRLNRKSSVRFKQHRDWLGMIVADRNLAVLLLNGGDAAGARRILEKTVTEENRVLDLQYLGRDYNNLSVAYSRLGDHAASRDALMNAIRYNAALGRKRLLAGNYHNLGIALAAIDDLPGALAAFERALDLSREVGTVDFEFQTLTDVVDTALRHQEAFEVLPGVLRRAYEILEVDAETLSGERVLEFGRVTQGLIGNPRVRSFRSGSYGARLRIASREGRRDLDEMTPAPSDSDFEGILRARLGDGMRGRFVPSVDELRQFLLLFTGDYFKSGNYTGEFDLTQERAKRHLRWLCGEGIIERFGTRKASRYALSFHREDASGELVVSASR